MPYIRVLYKDERYLQLKELAIGLNVAQALEHITASSDSKPLNLIHTPKGNIA